MTTTVILLVLAGGLLVAYLIRREARLRWLRGTTTPVNWMLNLILRSTAVAMGSLSFGAAVFGVFSTEVHLVLLSLGLLALALGAFQKTEQGN